LVLTLFLIWLAYIIIIKRKERESREELDRQEKSHQEEIHQMKMRFFINISHEMRTPLTLILNPLQEMILKNSDTWMRKQLKYVERNAKRLMHLINQLMDYRRAELGVFKLKIRPENVHKIIQENCGYYEPLAQSKKIQYSLLSEIEGKTFYVDGQYLELILNNLLSNAFKYTDAGNITVKATQNAEELCIEVCDTGKGIPEDAQNRIFERFYQVDSEHIGSGIGLSLVQKLVSLHHGRITLKSAEGEGSTFSVHLPVAFASPTGHTPPLKSSLYTKGV
jgi:signal transduction histidine kinase